jgi:hypothetical protein
MKVLFFYSKENTQTKRLENLIKTFVPVDAIVVFRSLEAIKESLREPLDNVATAVFVASSLAELKEFHKLKKSFFDLRHIIVLPEKDKKMIAAAHKLRPRFLSYFESDFNVVCAVLKKMYANQRAQNYSSTNKVNFERAI